MSDSLRQRLILPAFIGLLFINLCLAATSIYFLESRDKMREDLQECANEASKNFPGLISYISDLEKENKRLNRRLKRCRKVLDHFSNLYEE